MVLRGGLVADGVGVSVRRADVLVVLKRWKSFSRGGDEIQIYELQ